ncbi:MAG TPA: dTMP kinase [Verrucomicrobiae bacterium]|nr:dTMP kinase [Verrucomicrobiae bacterium]
MIPEVKALAGGRVIIFEGLDGAGKTTQLELVQKELEAAGWPVLALRNLGGTPIGEALREVIKSPLKRPPLTDFYVSLAIQEPLLDVIDRARKDGKIILMDRSPLSLAAYQIYGSGIDAELGWRHVRIGMERIKPEAILLYEITPEAALARKEEAAKQADYFESQPPEYFSKVAAGYKEAADRYDAATAVDGTASVAAIHDRTMDVIAGLLR